MRSDELDTESGELGESISAAAYRPHLDGLRAVAVYLVVLFHAGSHPFSGGYIGVDVFFVLSGFLVTQLLLRDVKRLGSIRFGRFYSRRFRRLLPAAFVALTVTAAIYTAIASPAEVAAAAGSFKAAFLYSTNWYFIHQATGYFGADITTNPVLHFWSLAVEEQFYLLWPLTLGGVFLLTRKLDDARQIRTIRIIIAVGALASAIWALYLRNSDPNRAYYGTDTRAYELLAGAFLALTPEIFDRARRFVRSTRIVAVLSVVALLVIASSWINSDAIVRGVSVTIATCALIIALEASTGGVVKRALSTRSMTYLGKVSYGTYLWHWLVILVVLRKFDVSTTSTIAISALVATALASLSFELLEHPIRRSRNLDRHRRVVIATGLAISVASALVLIPHIVDPANATTSTAQASITSGFTPVPANLDWKDAAKGFTAVYSCLHKPVSKCILVHGTGKTVLLMGDSHAAMLVPAMEQIARDQNFTLAASTRGGCPWQRSLFAFPVTVNGVTLKTSDCIAQKDDTYDRIIPELKPDIIVTMNVAHENPAELPFEGPHGSHAGNGSPTMINWLHDTTRQSLNVLRATGAKVLLVEPVPVAPKHFDPLTCISSAKVLEQCRYIAAFPQPDPLELYYRELAKSEPGVYDLDLDRVACPYFPICDPIVNGQIVKLDGTHLTPRFVKTIVPNIETFMQQVGLAR